MIQRILLCAGLCALGLAPHAVASSDRPYLPPAVEQVMARHKVPGTALSVYVREIGRDEPVVSYNATVPRSPASTIKVVTTYAALEMLGPAYTWRTRAYASGPVRDQVLEGNLVIEGGGDPFMTADRWWGFVAGLRQAGLARVTGDVVIDNSYFAPQGDDRGAFDNQPYRSYNVLPDALLVNFQTATFSLVPDLAAGMAKVSVNPAPANLIVENSVRLLQSGCRRGAGGVSIAMPDGPSGNRIAISGDYASGCGPLSFTRAIMRAPDFAYGTFRTLWQQSGGQIDGGWRVGAVPPGADLLYTHDSLSLAEVIRLVNKYSSNSMARALLLTLGAEKAGRPGTAAAGRQAIVEFLASRGIEVPELVLENGSGLSRVERISAEGLADVLTAAWRSQYMPEFAASLPLSATDGTLRKRFRAPEMQGRLRMKTGTLEGVSALAGYVNAASGRTYVTAIVLNHPGVESGPGEQVQAALIEWIFGR